MDAEDMLEDVEMTTEEMDFTDADGEAEEMEEVVEE